MGPSLSLNNGSKRLLKDKVAKFTIVAGGVLVLIALLLIFLYLLYVVSPVFKSADVELKHFLHSFDEQVLALGTDERQDTGFVFSHNARVAFLPLNQADKSPKWLEIASATQQVTGFASATPAAQTYAYIFAQSEFLLVQPKTRVSFEGGTRQLIHYLGYPMGEAPITLLSPGEKLTSLAFEGRDGNYLIAGLNQQQALTLVHFIQTPEVGYQRQELLLPMLPEMVEQVLFAAGGQTLFLRNKSQLWVYDLSSPKAIELKATVDLSPKGASPVEQIALLAGGSSLLVAHADNRLKLWFEIPSELGRYYQPVREYQVSLPVKAIYPEFYRKGFLLQFEQGQLALFFANSEKPLWQKLEGVTANSVLGLAPLANGMLLQQDKQLSWYQIDNAHPDVSWQSLWHKVWYESYPEADYVWQSTAATDDYEPKFSLIPLTFGTIKAALYAMLFSIPLALCAAIYSAYFMSARMRNWVKPGIEIIEALPTVILGFMAGLWLAPIIEKHLLGLLLFMFGLPLVIFALAFSWKQLPKGYKDRFSQGWYAIFLIPVVVVCMLLCLEVGPWFESLLFEHGLTYYMSERWGIDYDQRNAVVIGIAMGFAVTPTIFSIAEDAIGSVPKHLTDGSLALGATQWQTVIHVVLLTASPGIFAAVMMGLGRAVGETMIVLMATGNTPLTDWNIFEGMRTLAANIAIEMPESEVGSSHYRILFLAAFVLFIFTFVFNSAAEFVRQNLREKYSRM